MRNTLYFKGYEGDVVGLGTIALVVKNIFRKMCRFLCHQCFIYLT